MRELLILAVHLLVTFAKLLRPGGVRAVAAESVLLKHPLLITNRSRQRAPNLTTLDRVVLGLTTPFVSPRRIAKLGTLIEPAALFKFHQAVVDRKYRLLFSSSVRRRKPGRRLNINSPPTRRRHGLWRAGVIVHTAHAMRSTNPGARFVAYHPPPLTI